MANTATPMTITFNAALGASGNLTWNEVPVPLAGGASITFQAPASGYTVFTGTASPTFDTSGGSLTLQGVRFQGFAALLSDQPSFTLTLSGCKFDAATMGGPRVAVIGVGSKLNVVNTVFEGAENSKSNTYDPITTPNLGMGFGGAIMVDSAALTVAGSTFTSCKAEVGGAIAARANGDTSVLIESSTFTGCNATALTPAAIGPYREAGGGAIFVSGFSSVSISVKSSTFTACNAMAQPSSGGAIALVGTHTLAISGCEFTDNTAGTDGGAVNAQGANAVAVSDSTFTNNEFFDPAGYAAGALSCQDATTVDVRTSSFLGAAQAIPAVSIAGKLRPSAATFDRCIWDGRVINSKVSSLAISQPDYPQGIGMSITGDTGAPQPPPVSALVTR
jgi:predicted outer membrane repeat protein